ncbi:hypothetical protein DSCO28_62880 [Desulfosarcina ovata subsp. sediminis]|uniref:Uncharacterized protein n=1 Tax=Desulfosarcina ovata subsp. sediminis TaxID=885957 RepID=A0A5K7ZZP4_9BACT|nr:hypothetical protein [Desulfosarcina ovata]BBO85722.1 hypothetical protein DSCO28_62880 [Desulfosarcina ovata subsp. sediminis]
MKLSLKDALFLGFCAVFILSAKAVLRLHLKIPGHSMFFTLFFLLIARGCVQHRLAASTSALLAGVMAVILGMGKGGPLILVKFLIPGLVVDLMAGMIPGLFNSVLLCLITAAAAAATRFLSDCLVDYLAGMDMDILLQHAMIKSAGNVLFGTAGGMLVPAVIRKLRAYGVINGH